MAETDAATSVSPPPPSSGFTNPAPYGRACSNCARSKCKCMLQPGAAGAGGSNGPCERCHRLKKDCRPAEHVRRRPSRKPGSRTAQLEEKLDDLVTLLRSSARPGLAPGASGLAEAGTEGNACEGGPAEEQGGSNLPANNPFSSLAKEPQAPTPAATAPYATGYASPVSLSTPSAPEDVSAFEAEEAFQHFLAEKLLYFPFVYIPPGISAAQLQRERPFLWLCILAVSAKSSARQVALGIKIRRIIAEKLLVEHERSLETLVGLLCYIGWCNYQMGPQPFMCMYGHLVVGLVQDLGIDKPPPKDSEQHPMSCIKSHGFVLRLPLSSTRSMEERRAAVAAYLITSSISLFVRKSESLRWTPHLDECLQVLEEKQESPLDCRLVYQAKLQLIADEAKPAWNPQEPPSEHQRLLQVFQIKALQSRLQEIKRTMPPDLQADKAVQLHLYYAQLVINEIGLYTSTIKGPVPDIHRLDMLAACLHWTKTFFDVLISIPAVSYASFGFILFFQLSHLIVALYRLSTIDEPDWDRAAVRSTVDVLQLLEIIGDRFSRVVDEAGLISDRPDGDIFTKCFKAIRSMRAAWEPILNGASGTGGSVAGGAGAGFLPSASSAASAAQVGAGLPAAEHQGFDATMLDSFSSDFVEGLNTWMTDMFMPWEMIDTTR